MITHYFLATKSGQFFLNKKGTLTEILAEARKFDTESEAMEVARMVNKSRESRGVSTLDAFPYFVSDQSR